MLCWQYIEHDKYVDIYQQNHYRPKHHAVPKGSTFLFVKYKVRFDYKLMPLIFFPFFFLVVLASNSIWPQLQAPKHQLPASLLDSNQVLSFEMLVFPHPTGESTFGKYINYLGHIIWEPSLRSAGEIPGLFLSASSLWVFMARSEIWKSHSEPIEGKTTSDKLTLLFTWENRIFL